VSSVSGAFRLYDVDNDGFITRDEMYNIVDAIYQMVVRRSVAAGEQCDMTETSRTETCSGYFE
jgi:Ca2+-binding EF-hand superfamily protein